RRGAAHGAARGSGRHAGAAEPVRRRRRGRPELGVGGGRAGPALVRSCALVGRDRSGQPGGAGMTVAELTQRLRRADFLDGLGIYLEALEDAFVRPRGIVLASTAIADYLAFCRGGPNGPMGLLIAAGEVVELALLTGGRLVASQLVPARRLSEPAEVSRSLARQLAD